MDQVLVELIELKNVDGVLENLFNALSESKSSFIRCLEEMVWQKYVNQEKSSLMSMKLLTKRKKCCNACSKISMYFFAYHASSIVFTLWHQGVKRACMFPYFFPASADCMLLTSLHSGRKILQVSLIGKKIVR